MKILITTTYGDETTFFVARALERRGHKVFILMPGEIEDGSEWAYQPSLERLTFTDLNNQKISIHVPEIDVVWFRRLKRIFHISDIQNDAERGACETDTQKFVNDTLMAIGHGKFCINPISLFNSSINKLNQYNIAKKCGLNIPATIASNSYSEILEFSKCFKGIVHKPLNFYRWNSENNSTTTVNPTTYIEDIAKHREMNFQSCPAIYQEPVVKHGEVRVTVMGESIFAIKQVPIDRAQIKYIDWRIERSKFQFFPIDLPQDLNKKIIRLMKEMGLNFGNFDFGINSDGEFIFFEVNPSGQFLFHAGKDDARVDLLFPFVKFIESKSNNFKYVESNYEISEITKIDDISIADIEITKLSPNFLSPPKYVNASIELK